MFSPEQISLFNLVSECAGGSGHKIYIVGGMLRDIFLGHDPGDKDVDFIVEGDAIEFAEICLDKTGGTLKKFPAFLTAKISGLQRYGEISEIDFASSRREVYEQPGKLPQVERAPIKQDLQRRDFSINALAVALGDLLSWSNNGASNLTNLASNTLDFFSGVSDIRNRIIRILHERSFEDDPTRIFRAVRYAARINGTIETNSADRLMAAVKAGCLKTISNQRIVNEIKKILTEQDFEKSFQLLIKYKVVDRLSLFDAAKYGEVAALLCAAAAKTGGDRELLYQTALRIFYFFKKPGEDLGLNLGANELKKLAYDTRQDLDTGQKQTLQRLSAAGQVFQDLLKSLRI